MAAAWRPVLLFGLAWPVIKIGLSASTPVWLAAARATLSALTAFVLIDPWRFDWSDRAVVEGHGWLLLAGFSWALAVLHARRHRWRLAPLDVLPWQRAVATILLWGLAVTVEPNGYLDFSQPNLWIALFYIGVFAGPTGTWAVVSVARALPPVTGSLGMLGTPLLGIASSVVLVGEQVTFSLMLGTALVIGGIAIVIFDRSR